MSSATTRRATSASGWRTLDIGGDISIAASESSKPTTSMFGRPPSPVPPASRAPTAKVSLPQANAVGGSERLSSHAAVEAADGDGLGARTGQMADVQAVAPRRLVPSGAPLVAESGPLRPAEIGDPAVAARDEVVDRPRDAVRAVDVHPPEPLVPLPAGSAEAHEGDAAPGEPGQARVADLDVEQDEAVDRAGTDQVLVRGELVVDRGEQQHVVAGEPGGLGERVQEPVEQVADPGGETILSPMHRLVRSRRFCAARFGR